METPAKKANFIWDFVEEDLKSGRYQRVHTRFPPEPNGYLHIGHCKALVADFATAEHFGGVFYVFLRGVDSGATGVFSARPAPAELERLNEVLSGI